MTNNIFENKTITSRSILDGVEIMTYALDNFEKINSSRAKLEEDYLISEIFRYESQHPHHEIVPFKRAIIDYTNYEIHIKQDEVGILSPIKRLYCIKTKEYVCTYTITQHDEKTKDGVRIWFVIRGGSKN